MCVHTLVVSLSLSLFPSLSPPHTLLCRMTASKILTRTSIIKPVTAAHLLPERLDS